MEGVPFYMRAQRLFLPPPTYLLPLPDRSAVVAVLFPMPRDRTSAVTGVVCTSTTHLFSPLVIIARFPTTTLLSHTTHAPLSLPAHALPYSSPPTLPTASRSQTLGRQTTIGH